MRTLEHIDSGNAFDFGRMSEDYAKYRDIYPEVFFQKIHDLGLCTEGQMVLDLGTGTGVLPRGLAKYGAKIIGADISENQIAQARKLSEGMNIEYIISPAEEVDFPDRTFDTVMACMCFTYFDKAILLPRLARMLKDDGHFAIMSLVWLPGESSIAKGSEELVLKYNPLWNGSGYTRPTFDSNGIPTTYKVDTSLGFEVASSFAFDVSIPFTREAWHGRVKASRGFGASSLTQEQKESLEKEHWRFMEEQPESFEILHSATFCILKKQV
ncbi:SAM-dependent methyltransferase [Bacillus wiedmannii]|uniref:class I SAM-dependent methyltransferase n=1 Tax=Bacillus wiedmannii TaxID=1890302 RepID=UPI000BF10D20|nr:class I SAM-dependent methyltransferase [Bacillus wiedmannii]PEM85131.1 SAM-dependent methyltransferase [Bacillus wiedmannii]PEO82745.1 SAM-dependent methyltransferase [Bacillus wiedmannii]